ncbi:MAG: hypothetical protein C4K47_03065 [Candidatus Thorarchaeota archaeon]|nr:MAG: hypothetical protein C4K47_03065 [Candidatus Thorarchaeota archaeon]
MNPLESVLHLAFDNSAPYVTNLDAVRSLIQQAVAQTTSVDDAVTYIENRFPDAEITLKTDIRILVAAIRHAARQRKLSG